VPRAVAARGPRRAFPSALGWERIPAHAFESPPISRRDNHPGMEIDTALASVTGPAHRRPQRQQFG